MPVSFSQLHFLITFHYFLKKKKFQRDECAHLLHCQFAGFSLSILIPLLFLCPSLLSPSTCLAHARLGCDTAPLPSGGGVGAADRLGDSEGWSGLATAAILRESGLTGLREHGSRVRSVRTAPSLRELVPVPQSACTPIAPSQRRQSPPLTPSPSPGAAILHWALTAETVLEVPTGSNANGAKSTSN